MPITVALDGRLPDTATLSVLIGDEKENHWEDRPMDRGEDGLYRATIRRLLDSARYKIRAGNAETREYQIKVFKTPEITEFALRIEHPAYTGKGIELLPPGTGDVHALRGSKIHVDVKSNVDLGASSVVFKSRRAEQSGSTESSDPRKASLVFTVEKDDDYQVKIADTDGNPGSGALFQIKAPQGPLPAGYDQEARKDLMVHKEQTVEIEISADDDIGVREIGIFHSIDLDEKQIMVKRLDPQPVRVDGKLTWELGTMNLKGGEVIAYYAYAIDNDTVTPGGPKMSKSDIHFLTVYDEEKYDQENDPKKKDQKKPPGTPPEIKQLDKLIDVQKKLLKDAFAQARGKESLRDKEEADRTKAVEGEKIAAAKTADGQKQLRVRVENMIEEVKKELAQGDAGDEKPDAGNPGGPKQPPALGEKEMKHLEQAVERMKAAEEDLKKPDAPAAVKPETEALRHLSETRRLILSDKEGDPRFKMAMNKNSKKNQKKDQDQQQQDQQKAKEQLAEMPKMMEREKELDRELEQLSDKKRKPPQGEPQSEERKKQDEEKRELERKTEEDIQKLAKEAEARNLELEKLADRNYDLKSVADRMKAAQEELEKMQKELEKNKPEGDAKAQEENRQAQQDIREAQRQLRNALEKQVRQEVNNAQKDAQDLAQRQEDLAEKMQKLMNEQKDQKQDGQKQDGQKQDGQKQDGQKQDGQKQDGQKQDGQKQDGQKQDGQKQDGQKQDGQKQDGQKQDGQKQDGQKQDGQKQDGQKQDGQAQSAGGQKSGATPEQQMRGMAGEQRNVQNDMKELSDRLKSLGEKANSENLGGAKELDQAQKQSSEGSAANQAAEKAAQAMASGKQDTANKEAAEAAKALQQMAQTLQDAKQKTDAGDMKQLASAMKKLQAAAKEQADIGKDLGDKKDPNQLAAREEKVGDAAKELADAASHLETLRQSGNQDNTKNKLENAAKQADEAGKQMKEQNPAAAKTAGEQTEKSLNQALADMERAAGKSMEEKAREAQKLAKAARENQEKANEAIKDVPKKEAGEKLTPDEAAKRDDATAHEEQATREAKRLDLALEGLKELAKDANQPAAEVAKDARDTTQRAEVPKAMENLKDDMKRFGTDKKPQDPTSAKTPAEAAKKGEEIAQTLKQVDKQLDDYVAEARNSVEERLKSMEDAARKAAETAKAIADKNSDKNADQKNPDSKSKPDQANNSEKKPDQNAENKQPSENKQEANANNSNPSTSKKPDSSKLGDPKNPNQAKASDKSKADPENKSNEQNPEAAKGDEDSKPSEQDTEKQKESLANQLKKLQPKVDRLEPNAPEKAKLKDAMATLEQAKKDNENESTQPNGEPQAGKKNMGGPAFRRVSKQMDEIAQGIMERRERLLRARDIRPDEDEDAPKEYRTLVDKYYQALSEDVEVDKK